LKKEPFTQPTRFSTEPFSRRRYGKHSSTPRPRYQHHVGGLWPRAGDAGNVLSVENSEGDVAGYTWGPQHRLATMASPGLPATTYSYDSRGNLETVVDSLGRETYTRANAHGNVELTRDALRQESTTAYWYDHPWMITDAAGGVTTYEHDENGNTVATTRTNGDQLLTTAVCKKNSSAFGGRGGPIALPVPTSKRSGRSGSRSSMPLVAREPIQPIRSHGSVDPRTGDPPRPLTSTRSPAPSTIP
jgi:YD repeat-containing protein